jgi:hypothetical protein
MGTGNSIDETMGTGNSGEETMGISLKKPKSTS